MKRSVSADLPTPPVPIMMTLWSGSSCACCSAARARDPVRPSPSALASPAPHARVPCADRGASAPTHLFLAHGWRYLAAADAAGGGRARAGSMPPTALPATILHAFHGVPFACRPLCAAAAASRLGAPSGGRCVRVRRARVRPNCGAVAFFFSCCRRASMRRDARAPPSVPRCCCGCGVRGCGVQGVQARKGARHGATRGRQVAHTHSERRRNIARDVTRRFC